MKKGVMFGLFFLLLSNAVACEICNDVDEVTRSEQTIQHAKTVAVVKTIVQQYKDKKIVVLFDLDNTLIRPSSPVTSVEFFIERGKRRVLRGASIKDTMHELAAEWAYLSHYDTLTLIEPEAALDLFTFLRNEKIDTLGLTARASVLAFRTCDQLAQLGISFIFPYKYNQLVVYGVHEAAPAIFKDNILFCGLHNEKEDILMRFFAKIGYKPEMIVFVEDQKRNLKAMKKMCKKNGIMFHGIRVSMCDNYYSTLHLAAVEKELEQFKEAIREVLL